jgi:hypothetical protein
MAAALGSGIRGNIGNSLEGRKVGAGISAPNFCLTPHFPRINAENLHEVMKSCHLPQVKEF